ncbi:MAG: hypothetical protein NC912_01485 [Candidatus Omnitrophica bacterium]|nr:hypothetical protein [Candidatus Omnitrophota bacterium]
MVIKRKALTLIELITIIVVLGVAIPVLLRMWAEVALRSSRSEAIAEATFYAEELMEEIKSKEFVDPQDRSNPNLGPNSGENQRLDYDDVDDFNGYLDSPAPGYTRRCIVDYVTLNTNIWESSASTTNFKRITVSVLRSEQLAGEVSLVTIVTFY